MASTTIEKELLGLEKQYWQAMKDKDVEAVMRLTDDPCIVAGAQGVALVGKPALAAMIEAAPYKLHAFDVNEEVQVRRLSEDVAALAYKVHEELTVEGRPVTLDAADSSIWIRRDGRWVCALHTESILGDPFGHDRK